MGVSIVHLELSTELSTGGQWRCIKVDIEGMIHYRDLINRG